MKIPTLSIGIPAYNEERNIASLLKSIFSQQQNNFILEKIYIVFDGTDKTGKIVNRFMKKNKNIKLYKRNGRKGKADALNLIYAKNQSDLLLTLDADIVFRDNQDITIMVKEMNKNNNLNMVGPRHQPIMPNTLMGKFAYFSYLSFEDAFLKINNGNNYYVVMNAELMRKKFTKSFTFPKGTISDQNYVYAMAIKYNSNAFKLVKNACVLFQPVTTFKDWRILGVRSVYADKQNVVDLVGDKVLKLYTMPKHFYIFSLIKFLFKSPLYTIGAVLMNIYIRKFPYNAVKPKNGLWLMTDSSKTLEVSSI